MFPLLLLLFSILLYSFLYPLSSSAFKPLIYTAIFIAGTTDIDLYKSYISNILDILVIFMLNKVVRRKYETFIFYIK